MKMNLTGAIKILKLHKHTTDKFKHSIGDQYVSDAIDMVVKALEKSFPTDDEIIEKANEVYPGEEIVPHFQRVGFTFGAKWIRDLIQERSKK